MTEIRHWLKKGHQVHLNWPASKEYLATYVKSWGGNFLVHGLIYNLGHYGRGLDDFGKEIYINFGKARFLDPASYRGQRLEGVKGLHAFFGIISGQIIQYAQAKPDITRLAMEFQEMVNAIEAQRKSSFFFSRDRNGIRDLELIEDYYKQT